MGPTSQNEKETWLMDLDILLIEHKLDTLNANSSVVDKVKFEKWEREKWFNAYKTISF